MPQQIYGLRLIFWGKDSISRRQKESVRYRLYNYIELEDVPYQSFGGTAEYEAAKKLTEALQEAYGFVIPEKIKVSACISEMFIRISEEFGIDLSDDQDLHHYLYKHIPLMIIRLKNHMSFRYPGIGMARSSYAQVSFFQVKLQKWEKPD
ncbi:hypothetical protein [Lacrimispora sp.]|uniref:hypothetical protein n=1 Tax=Lacrimispora sp. TaxID=2719234 RepID=UPI0034614352